VSEFDTERAARAAFEALRVILTLSPDRNKKRLATQFMELLEIEFLYDGKSPAPRNPGRE
jgi:hypothetical protein